MAETKTWANPYLSAMVVTGDRKKAGEMRIRTTRWRPTLPNDESIPDSGSSASTAAYPTKRRVNPGLGFFSFDIARRTIGGYEAMNMIRKGQIERVGKGSIQGHVRFVSNLFRIAA